MGIFPLVRFVSDARCTVRRGNREFQKFRRLPHHRCLPQSSFRTVKFRASEGKKGRDEEGPPYRRKRLSIRGGGKYTEQRAYNGIYG